MMKKLMSFIVICIMVLQMSVCSKAEGLINDLEYQEYLTLVEENVIGPDVSFEQWHEANMASANLERLISNNNEFVELAETDYLMQRGDIFVTSATSSKGLTGHAGIAIGDDISGNWILHIAGPGENPSLISFSEWNKRYVEDGGGWTKIYRSQNILSGRLAADWAENAYKGSSAIYKITNDLTSTDETYCSKIVWQAYYYGPYEKCTSGLI